MFFRSDDQDTTALYQSAVKLSTTASVGKPSED